MVDEGVDGGQLGEAQPNDTDSAVGQCRVLCGRYVEVCLRGDRNPEWNISACVVSTDGQNVPCEFYWGIRYVAISPANTILE